VREKYQSRVKRIAVINTLDAEKKLQYRINQAESDNYTTQSASNVTILENIT
jgi:hypothetical protein